MGGPVAESLQAGDPDYWRTCVDCESDLEAMAGYATMLGLNLEIFIEDKLKKHGRSWNQCFPRSRG